MSAHALSYPRRRSNARAVARRRSALRTGSDGGWWSQSGNVRITMHLPLRTSLVVALCLATPTAVEADVEASTPRTGMAGLLVGVAGVVAGTYSLSLIPAACIGGISDEVSPPCAASLGAAGASLLTAGVVGLTLGGKHRRAYNAWRRRRAVALVPTFEGHKFGIRMVSRF